MPQIDPHIQQKKTGKCYHFIRNKPRTACKDTFYKGPKNQWFSEFDASWCLPIGLFIMNIMAKANNTN